MIYWLIGLVLMGGLGYGGRAIGAVRYAVVLIGLWIGYWAAFAFNGKLTDMFIEKKLENPLMCWVLPPAIIYFVCLIIFGSIAAAVYVKVLVFYKYKVPDEKRVSWERMDRGVGISMGVAVGASLLIHLGVGIHAAGYWTKQIVSGGENPKLVKIFNPLKDALRGSGLERVVASIDPMPDRWYEVADVVGIVYNNPGVSRRLTTYPGTIALAESEPFRAIAKDDGLSSAFETKANFEEIMKASLITAILYDSTMMGRLMALDWVDLRAYLETGESEKYDDEILGRWDMSLKYTVVATSELHAGAEALMIRMGLVEKQWPYIAKDLQFLAAGDGATAIKGRISEMADVESLLKGMPIRGKTPNTPPDEGKVIANGTWAAKEKIRNSSTYELKWNNKSGGVAEVQEGGRYIKVPFADGMLVFRKQQ